MKALVTSANVAGLVAALTASVLAATLGIEQAEQTTRVARPHAEDRVVVRNGARGLLDATDHFVPLRDYRRIVSVSGVADDLVHALSEPDRVVAYSAYASRSASGYRFGDKVLVSEGLDPETLVGLDPDLVLINNLSRHDRLARLRETGINVFDLGEMRGLSTLVPNARTVGILLGRPEAGAELAYSIARRMQTLAAAVPAAERKRAIYAGIHGDKIYGGSRGTSYADVLQAAGLIDAAAERYRDWPRYTSEQLLELDPPIIVTQTRMAQTLCRHPGLSALQACTQDGVVEIDTALLLDPGLDMGRAAEEIQRRVFGHLITNLPGHAHSQDRNASASE